MDSRLRAGWQRLFVLAGMLLVLLGLQACASIVSGAQQGVSVDTPGCPGARCELSNDKGKFFVASTPGTVTLSRSYNNLQVTCSRDGASSAPLSVASTTKGMAFGNILFGGVIGAGVDMHTGAAYDYPQLINVPLQCGAGSAPLSSVSAAAPVPQPRLGLQVERLTALPGAPAPQGARVLQVAPQSPAEAAGVLPGDVILQVDGRPVLDPDGLAAEVAASSALPANTPDGARVLTLTLRRGSEELLRRLMLPAAPL